MIILHFFSSGSDADNMANGAVWLYKATQNPNYLNEAKNFYAQGGHFWAFSWDNARPGVAVSIWPS